MPVKNWFSFISVLMLLCIFCNLANAQTKKKRIIHHRQKIDTSVMDLNCQTLRLHFT